MRLSCGLPPSPGLVRLATLAENLGYHRLWLPDSPLLLGDVWISMARVAEATKRIGVGAAVIVPHLRHVATTAAAIGTVEQLRPGCLEVAIGTGFTARAMMGKRPLSWKYVEQYVTTLRALLAGETVTIEGAAVKLMHAEPYLARRPLPTPLLLAANGAKGVEIARRLGLGHMCAGMIPEGTADGRYMVFGSVLDDDESFSSDSVFDRLGPAIAVLYHGTYAMAGTAVDSLPGGAAWRAAIEKIPENVRHLYLHEDHLVRVTERDRPYLSRDLAASTFSGTREQIRDRLTELRASGITEIIFWPTAADTERELRTMATAVNG